MSVSTSCCAAQYTGFSSDDNVLLESCEYRELQQRMQQHAASGCIIKALETLNFMRDNVPDKPTVYDYNAMIRYLLKSGSVAFNELFEVYSGMKRFGPSPNLLIYQTLLNGFISVGRSKDAMYITDEMLACGFSPSFTILSKLFKKLLKTESVVDAVLLLEIMFSVNYIPSQYDISVLIQGLCHVRKVQVAISLFVKLLGKGYFCGGIIYNPILWALCKSNRTCVALAIFGFLEKKGFVHSVYSYTALVHGFSKDRLWREAFFYLEEMENVGCKPSLVTYTVLIKSLCDDGKVDVALNLLEKMEERGYNPDLVVYNIVLREFCNQGRVDDVYGLIQLIDQKGLSADMYTHAALAGGMLKRGNVEFVNKFNSGEALSLMQSMMEKGFRPTNRSYNILLKGLCEGGNFYEALKLFDYIMWPSNGPDLISLNTVLSAACKLGNSTIVQGILWQMEHETRCCELNIYYCIVGHGDRWSQTDWSFGWTTYNVVIRAFIHEGNDLMVDELSREICSHRLRPDVGTYGCFVHDLCRRGKMARDGTQVLGEAPHKLYSTPKFAS
ncbi:hypothetical protein SASPL_138514 [Salvia splendens]|uniref:Leucine-rich PPR motif-containing protein, mitochondrial n=1 Tax=Salvia splendens TaxID=180675 RepID=A0A8X8WVB3_SALSN|nr:hypothetical protein SASPL_138514 [Salvia splendens]